MSERITHPPGRRRRAGFTLVELLVVVAITTLGFIALLNLQIGTLHGAANARDTHAAISLAEHVANTMRMEALQWTPTSGPLGGMATTRFLRNAPATTSEGTTSQWFVAYAPTGSGSSSDLRIGAVGNDAQYDAGVRQEVGTTLADQFCVHYRFTWLVPEVLLRADIRVMWPRRRADFTSYALCPVGMEANLYDVNQITVPVTVLRNVFVKQGV